MNSKLLEYLKVPSNVSDGFEQGFKDTVMLVDGLQEVYHKSPDSVKKKRLGIAIAELTRSVMDYLKQIGAGIYQTGTQPMQQVQQPQQPEPKPTITTVKPPRGQRSGRKPPMPQPQEPQPQEPQQQTQSEPQPQQPQSQQQPQIFTRKDYKAAIKGLEVLVRMGNKDAEATLKGLKILLKRAK